MDGAPPPERWLMWLWAAFRAAWITAFPLLCGAGMLAAAWFEMRLGGRFTLAGLNSLVVAVLFLALAWYSARYTWQVMTGARAPARAAIAGEIVTTSVVFGVLLVLFAMFAPYFAPIFRRSAEGAVQNRLAALRQTVSAHRAAHEGRAPAGLEDLGPIPPLWGRAAKVPHPEEPAAIVVEDATPNDTGKWAYVISPSSPSLTGTVFIDCTHTDYRGKTWTAY